MQTPIAVALSAKEVNQIANQITVLIQGPVNGSGIIIAKDGNTYTVLTAKHVVKSINPGEEASVVTHDGQSYQLDTRNIKNLPDVDLAVVKFTSSKSYRVAKLGNSDKAPGGTSVYVGGFPLATAAINQSIFLFTEGKVTANASRPLEDGYALVYTNNTLPGMSGCRVHTSCPKPHFAPPAPQIWGEIGIFLSSKSPRIGGFRGLKNLEVKTKDLCVHSRYEWRASIE